MSAEIKQPLDIKEGKTLNNHCYWMATYKNSFLSNGFVGVLIGCVFEGQLVGPIEANLEDFC